MFYDDLDSEERAKKGRFLWLEIKKTNTGQNVFQIAIIAYRLCR